MTRHALLAAGVALALVGCSQLPTPTPSATADALYQLDFRDVGAAHPTVSAGAVSSPLARQALTTAPEPLLFSSSLATSTFVYTSAGVSTRHLQVTLTVTNTSGTTINNLTFLPVITTDTDGNPGNNAQTPTVAGTPFRAVRYFDGTDASSTATSLTPAGGQLVDLTTGQPYTDPLTSPFVQGLDITGVSVTPPAGLSASAMPVGWTAAASLAPGASANVTFAVDVAGITVADPKADPYSFSLLFTGAMD